MTTNRYTHQHSSSWVGGFETPPAPSMSVRLPPLCMATPTRTKASFQYCPIFTPVHPLTLLPTHAQHPSCLTSFTECERFNKKISGQVFWVMSLFPFVHPQLLLLFSSIFPSSAPLSLTYCYCLVVAIVTFALRLPLLKSCPFTVWFYNLVIYLTNVYFDLRNGNDAYSQGCFEE